MKKMIFVLFAFLLTLCLVGCNAEKELPKLYFEGDMAAMYEKSDVRSISVKYEDGSKSFEGYASIKVQGTSSLYYPKKNYTITFYEDTEHAEKKAVDMGWGAQSKYCLKANWIDKTHARNVVTANLVTQVQEKYGLLDNAPANGAIDGFPCEIYLNGEFLGLYTFNIPKDDWMFGMDSDNPDHIVICGEGWELTNLFRAEPQDLTMWAVEVGEESEETLNKVKRLFGFVLNSTDEEFKENIDEYLNLDALLNYYIISDMAYLYDNRGKNMLIATYDGKLWYPVLYDLDTSWGTNWQGDGLLDYANTPLPLSDNKLFGRLETCFSQELYDRYFELRKTILTKEHIMNMFQEFESSIPEEVFQKEVERWGTEIPGYEISQIEEYLNTVMDRLDSKYAAFESSK